MQQNYLFYFMCKIKGGDPAKGLYFLCKLFSLHFSEKDLTLTFVSNTRLLLFVLHIFISNE